MKKTLSVFLAFILCVVLLAGCGKEDTISTYTEDEVVGDEIVANDAADTDASEGDAAGSSDKTDSQQGGDSAKSGKKASSAESAIFENVPQELRGTTVKFATWIDHKSCDYAHVFSDFEKKTGIKVQIVAIPQTEYIVKLMGMKASGTAPDVIVDNFEFPRTLPLLQPLTVEKTGVNIKDSVWDQEVAKLYTINGKCYAIAGSNSNWQMASPLVYYNIPLLRKYGIKTPADYVKENNWTLDTMKKCAEDCKDAGISTPCEIDVAVFSNVYGDGPYHYDASTSKYTNTMKSEKFRQMWNYLTTNREKGLFKLSNAWASSLTSGETGFVLSGAYGLRKQPGWFYQMDANDIGYAYLPKNKKSDAQYPTSTFARGYGIADGSKNPKGAGYFLRYFLNDDWYEDDEIFKDSRAAKMHHELLKMKNFSHPELDGVVLTQYEDFKAFYNDLTTSTPQQVSSNIDKVSQKMDYCIKKANALIDAAR